MAAIYIIKSGYAKRFSDLAKYIMHQAHLGQDLYLTSSAGDFELVVWNSGRYTELGQRQVHRSGRGGHNGGRVNGERGDNSHNRIVILLQQGDINSNHVPDIDRTTIYAELYSCRMPGHLSNNCPEVPAERHRNHRSGDRGSVGIIGTGMCHIIVVLSQHDDGIIPSTWLLIDTCSASSFGKNPDMFNNIQWFLEE